MHQEVHGHEVIALILESHQAYTRESLAEAIEARYGPETRFFTCSAKGMTAHELIAFLERRSKFRLIEGGLDLPP